MSKTIFEELLGDNDEAQSVTQFIDTGFGPLNEVISGKVDGGLPYGRLIEMFGESSSGKTALASQWMIQAQKMGGAAGFIDWERSYSVELGIEQGLNVEQPFWLYRRSKTWEEGNMIASKYASVLRDKKMISPEAPILIVFDSIASAIPKSVMYDSDGKLKELDELTMNDTTALARVSSATLKTQAVYAAEFNATFLYLNQVRVKPGVSYGNPEYTPGGKAMGYYATTRLALSRAKMKDAKEFIGQEITIEVVKSKLTKPFQKTMVVMDFDDNGVAQFNYVASIVDYLIENKKIEYAKPRLTWNGVKYFKKAFIEYAISNNLYVELQALAAK